MLFVVAFLPRKGGVVEVSQVACEQGLRVVAGSECNQCGKVGNFHPVLGNEYLRGNCGVILRIGSIWR